MTKIKMILAATTIVFAAVAIGQVEYICKAEPSREIFKDDLPDYKWMQEAWTGTDTPFLKIQNNVENALSNAKSDEIARLVTTYKKEAELYPEDAQKQFKWAYSSYKAARNGYRNRSIRGDAQDLSFALQQANSPSSYVYTRLRFLLAMRWKSEEFKLKPLAERLLKRNSNDYDVLYAARNTLQRRTSEAERNQGLGLLAKTCGATTSRGQ